MSSPDAMQHGACTALVDPEITLQRSEIGQIHKRWDNILCKGPLATVVRTPVTPESACTCTVMQRGPRTPLAQCHSANMI